MKIRKNGKTVNLTESDLKKIVKGNKEDSVKFKKNGEVVNLNETEIKQIVNKYKINKFLSEQAITRSMRDEIHDLMKAYERIINSKVGGIDILADSKVEDLMSKVKRAMLQNVEELRKEVRSSEDKKRSEIEKSKNN
tara:strand:+ start:131 stop:541 length:411 start_codon:yes stop_codon:yes gene_type:complete